MTTLRPRTAGLDALRRRSFRAYYEPFTPKVEEKEETEAHILQLELTDFDEQQIRVGVEEGARTVAVTGTRTAGNNRWLRVDKTYPIPENCIIDKIYHKFDEGILTITMPKQNTEPETAAAAESTVAAPPAKEPEQPTPEISPATAAAPETETETKAPEEALPKDDSKGKSAELQKQASAGAREEAPPQGGAAAEKGPARGDSGEPKTTSQYQKIGSPERKPTEKREIENQNSEQGKESKTEEVDKNQEEPKDGTGAPSPTATTAGKLGRGVTVGRMPSPAMASLAAVTVIAVAAYFASVYYGLLATK